MGLSLTFLGSLIAFVYGTIVGSFLNVCIYRWPEEQSIVSPPSHCPKCGTRLKYIDLVPLFSFLFLGRKCRYCKVPISWRYFTIELITGIIWVLTFLGFGFSIEFFVYVLFLSFMLVAFVVDMEHFIIPDQVSIIGIVLGLGKDVAHLVAGTPQLVRIPLPFTDFKLPMLPSILGIVLCGGAFYLLAYVSFYAFKPKDPKDLEEYEGAMGAGDVKLAAAIGAVVGCTQGFVSFLIAVVLGTISGIAMLIFKARAEKKGVEWRTQIPFGPYMVLGAVAVMFFFPQLGVLWKMWVALIAGG